MFERIRERRRSRARKNAVSITAANPEEFGKRKMPVRDRMAQALRETSPEERLEKGR